MKILGTICARGGSKGVPNKNIRLLLGKPLIVYTINALKMWGKADRIICSSDSNRILEIALEHGIDVLKRPDYLATDDADKLDVLKHLVEFCEKEEGFKYDYIIDLDPTSPLRTIIDMDNAFNKFMFFNADILYSAYPAHKNPYFNMVEINEKGYGQLCKEHSKPVMSRQQAPKVYSINGSIYIYKRDFLLNTDHIIKGKNIVFEMDDVCIDIDKQIDFEFIKFILKEKLFKFDYKI